MSEIRIRFDSQPDMAEWREAVRLERPVADRFPAVYLPFACAFVFGLVFMALAFGVPS